MYLLAYQCSANNVDNSQILVTIDKGMGVSEVIKFTFTKITSWAGERYS